jgi:3-hydroxy-9,10-secoandrosta-1,3,5(10)-triene-9,17-dione monooxygenase
MQTSAKIINVPPAPAELIARARAMIPVLAGRAAIGERERRLPAVTIADMQAAGFFRVLQPKRWGGYELDPLTAFEIQMALAEGDMSVAWVYGVVGMHPWLLSLYDDRAAQEVWGEDDATLICSSLIPAGTATPAPGGFRISGRWRYSSGCEHTAWAFLGGTVTGAADDRRIFLLPKRDYQIVDAWHVSGLKGTGSQDIVVQDAFVPEYRSQKFSDNFRGYGPGHAVNSGPLYRLPFGQIFFRGISTGAIGALQGMLDAFIAYGKSRIHRIHGTRASEDPLVQFTCAEAAAAIDEMKTILHRNFRNLESYAARGEMPPLQLRIQYKFHSSMVAERCSVLAARLFKAAGGAGIYEEHPFGRMLADITAARQHISNHPDVTGRSFGATLFGMEETKDYVL